MYDQEGIGCGELEVGEVRGRRWDRCHPGVALQQPQQSSVTRTPVEAI